MKASGFTSAVGDGDGGELSVTSGMVERSQLCVSPKDYGIKCRGRGYIPESQIVFVFLNGGRTFNFDELIERLESRPDLVVTKMNWSTGIIVAAKVI